MSPLRSISVLRICRRHKWRPHGPLPLGELIHHDVGSGMENAPRAVQQGRRLSRCIVEVTSRSKRDRLFPAFEYLISAGCAPWIVVMDRVKGVPCTRRAGDGIVAGMRKPARAPGPVEAGSQAWPASSGEVGWLSESPGTGALRSERWQLHVAALLVGRANDPRGAVAPAGGAPPSGVVGGADPTGQFGSVHDGPSSTSRSRQRHYL